MLNFAALCGVEALHRLHQADVSLGNEVGQGKPVARVILGDLYDQPQVRLDHVGPGLLVALLDACSQFHLLGRSQQVRLRNLSKVNP